MAKTHRILFLIGDDFGDFIGGVRSDRKTREGIARKYAAYWGWKWFQLPNPTYGSWERARIHGHSDLTK